MKNTETQKENDIAGTVQFIINNEQEYRKLLLKFTKLAMALLKLRDNVKNDNQLIMASLFDEINTELRSTFLKLQKPYDLVEKAVKSAHEYEKQYGEKKR